ncbi:MULTISPECIES: hypothetical protein [Leptolyngbya]|nr:MULTISPECIES: hypothetical protein [Leptolyngbya]
MSSRFVGLEQGLLGESDVLTDEDWIMGAHSKFASLGIHRSQSL